MVRTLTIPSPSAPAEPLAQPLPPCPEKQGRLGQPCADPQILTDRLEKLQMNLSSREMVPKARICSCTLSDSTSQGKMICGRDREAHQHGGSTWRQRKLWRALAPRTWKGKFSLFPFETLHTENAEKQPHRGKGKGKEERWDGGGSLWRDNRKGVSFEM